MLRHDTYRIERILGQGGFGITYLATDLCLKRKVAIKEFFPKDYCGRETATSHVTLGTQNANEFVNKLKAKFLKEARTIAKFDHPGIIKIHAAFEENNTAYYVMDYIEGESLSEIVKRFGALPETKAVEYISKVGEALEYVHARKINHLDIKPANIMVRRSDDNPILIDFGLSKQYDSSGNQTSTTPTGISHGYAPMEQYNDGGVHEFSPQTDIYSLGATLYYILSGITPPNATKLIEYELSFPATIPHRLIAPISKAMSPVRRNRYTTVDLLIEDLNGKQSGDDTEILNKEMEPNPKPAPQPKPSSVPEYPPRPTIKKRLCTSLDKPFWKWTAVVIIILGCFFYYIKDEYDVYNSDGTINGHGWVDLGLPSGLKWATCNIGASNPCDYGDYFAWGEIHPKSSYDLKNNVTRGKSTTELQLNGIIDSKGVLNKSHDAASTNWGGSWRMPTELEMEELANNCTWTWTTIGYKVTGGNGKSIFLPACGIHIASSFEYGGNRGLYWSSSYDVDDNEVARYLKFNHSIVWKGCLPELRSIGCSIRPVSE